MKFKHLLVITMMVSSLLFIASFSVEAADVTISDGMGDVSSVDYVTGKTNVITNSPDIDVDNLDLTQATYIQQGTQATVSLQVKGNIENRGKIIDPYSNDPLTVVNTVEYGFTLTTSGQDYSISYCNNAGKLSYGAQQISLTSSDFSVVGNTLTITFTLISAAETYSELSVTSTFTKANFSSIKTEGMVYLSDVAPNPPLMVYDAYASNIGTVCETIQFNASVEPLTGQPPYTYRWDFGDQGSSTQLNPTHTYTKAGVHTYTFTVIDSAGATASKSGTISISGQSISADFTWTPTNPNPGQTITFDASASYPDCSIALYEWDWNNDGVYEESNAAPTATHSWSQADIYLVILRVTDTGSMTSTKTIPVYVGDGDQTPNTSNNSTSPKTPGFEIILIIGAISLVMFWRRKRIM
jgi:PKD repeat protein